MQANETTIWYASKGSGGQGLIADEVTGRSVAVCYDETDKDLLAAAPELLQACREMLRTLTAPSRQLLDTTRQELAPWIPMLRAAIAKAEGR